MSSRLQTQVDRRLGLLVRQAQPGRRYTQAEIAQFCACSKSWIGHIERPAISKLRKLLKREGVQ